MAPDHLAPDDRSASRVARVLIALLAGATVLLNSGQALGQSKPEELKPIKHQLLLQGIRSAEVRVLVYGPATNHVNIESAKFAVEWQLRKARIEPLAASDFVLWVLVQSHQTRGSIFYLTSLSLGRPVEVRPAPDRPPVRTLATVWSTERFGRISNTNGSSLNEKVYQMTDEFVEEYAKVNAGYTYTEPDNKESARLLQQSGFVGISALKTEMFLSDDVANLPALQTLNDQVVEQLKQAGITYDPRSPFRLAIDVDTISGSTSTFWTASVSVKVFRDVVIRHHGESFITEGRVWRVYTLGPTDKGNEKVMLQDVQGLIKIFITDFKKVNP